MPENEEIEVVRKKRREKKGKVIVESKRRTIVRMLDDLNQLVSQELKKVVGRSCFLFGSKN